MLGIIIFGLFELTKTSNDPNISENINTATWNSFNRISLSSAFDRSHRNNSYKINSTRLFWLLSLMKLIIECSACSWPFTSVYRSDSAIEFTHRTDADCFWFECCVCFRLWIVTNSNIQCSQIDWKLIEFKQSYVRSLDFLNELR